MPKKPKSRKAVYRDKRTGRFVSKATWKRSGAHGGKRNYVRALVLIDRKRKPRLRPRKRIATRPTKRPRRKTEYQINIRYDAGRESNKVEVQISAIGPSGRTRKQVLNAVERKMKNALNDQDDDDVTDPHGWKIHIIFWEKHGKQFFGDDAQAWRQLNFLFTREEAEVTRKDGEEVR